MGHAPNMRNALRDVQRKRGHLGLRWRDTGEGYITEEGTCESHLYYTNVLALINGTGSGWKGRGEWLDLSR